MRENTDQKTPNMDTFHAVKGSMKLILLKIALKILVSSEEVIRRPS